MLSAEDKELIRGVDVYYFSRIDVKESKLIPSFDDLKSQVFSQLEMRGFKAAETSKFRANCIVRIYKNECAKYDSDSYRFFGANCFTKKSLFGPWYSISNNGSEFVYNSKRGYQVRMWFFQDEYHDFESTDHVDLYLKISREK